MKTTLAPDIELLSQKIEEQLGWGNPKNWTNKDFVELSELIFSQTKQQISATTLKRVFGRAKLDSKPSVTTLDILSAFAGYDDWRSFHQQQEEEAPVLVSELKPISFPNWLGVMIFCAGLLSVLVLQQSNLFPASPMPLSQEMIDEIEFDFEAITVGYPNTVMFRYDFGEIPFDSIEIQQSWDSGRRIRLTDPKGLATATYYEAGYYNTKLILNGQIIKEKDLYIPTDGWQAFVAGNVPNRYPIGHEALRLSPDIGFEPEVIEEMNRYPFAMIWLANLTLTPSINSAVASIDTEFRLQQPTDKSMCQNVWMVIMGTKDVYRFQFSIPGCVGDLQFFLNMDMVSGKNRDLSAFGLDMTEWNHFQVQTTDSLLTASINEKPIFSHKLYSDIGQIGGVQFIFEGIGEVRQMRMRDAENVIDLVE